MDIGCTERTRRLKNTLVSKACYQGKYHESIFVDISRAKLYTQSYQLNQHDEPVRRRAKVLKHVLENISLDILPDELIVGNPHADPHALSIFPEQNLELLSQAVEDGYVLNEDKKTAEELLAFWNGKTMADKVAENMSDWIREVVDVSSSFISTTWKDGIQHSVPNWDYAFENGTEKLKIKIQKKLEETRVKIDRENHTADLSQLINARYLYEAMLISLEGFENYTVRYSQLAKEKARTERDTNRRMELEKMSEMLKHTLHRRPESFWEACQGFFFMHLILNCIDSAAFGSLIRIDQALYPFFKKDVLEQKNLTELEAQELVECLILKVQALGSFFSRNRRLHFEGNGALPIWTVGGVHSDGSDASNELTDVILRAARSVRCNQPTISIIYHKKMRTSSLDEAIKTLRTGLGYPSITNLEWVEESLTSQGMSIEAARNSGVVGCVSCCPVDACNTTKRLALEIIAAKCMELALNEGKCILTNKKLGPDERPAEQFRSYNELVQAIVKQLTFATCTAANVRNLARHYEMIYRPNPLVSAMHRSPLEKGLDAVCYEDYPNNYWMNFVGVVNIVNSLAVIKKLVFDEKKYTIAQFIDAIKTNWQDKEDMRQECINKVPKFGNNDPYVDAIAKEVFNCCAEAAHSALDINGGYWSMLAQSVSIYQATAGMTSALPDGKLAKKPLADGGISPDHGTDREGIFAVLSSVAKVDHKKTKGLLLNQWLAPEMIEGEAGLERMKTLLKFWSEKKISQIQFNVVDPDVLRDAQKHPEKYPHLTIRVSGYTANWVKLTEELQNIILSRTYQQRM